MQQTTEKTVETIQKNGLQGFVLQVISRYKGSFPVTWVFHCPKLVNPRTISIVVTKPTGEQHLEELTRYDKVYPVVLELTFENEEDLKELKETLKQVEAATK